MSFQSSDDTISVPNIDLKELDAPLAVASLVDIDSDKSWPLAPTENQFVIGTAANCNIQLRSPYVSAEHCTLERRPGGRLVVRDLRSKNGVFVGSTRVTIADITVGTSFVVGGVRLRAVSRLGTLTSNAERQLVGKHPLFCNAIALAKRAAKGHGSCNVVILGETGTGKELFARLIHEASPRTLNPFVTVNCGSLTNELIGSELFGHVRGAFTDATTDRPGLFAQADSGTLFLDEIGELPLAKQPHLLRVLESGELRPLGGSSSRRVDVRVVAATNRLDLVESGVMRTDLYHRLATVVISLPPLRERASDIPALVRAFIRRANAVRSVRPETYDALGAYSWPGNVRELGHAVQRAVALCEDELTVEALLHGKGEHAPQASIPPAMVQLSYAKLDAPFNDGVRDLLASALLRYGSIRRTARALGIPKSTLADRVARYGISVHHPR